MGQGVEEVSCKDELIDGDESEKCRFKKIV